MKNLKQLTLALASVFTLGALHSDLALAEDRALLIGVGAYANSKYNLPGIDLDINMMKEVAETLGFKPHNIKVLLDKDTSLSNLRSTMQSWLIDGTGVNDRVLIYYSGHGAPIPDENGDEEDKADEVLTLHELDVVERGGKATLMGVLVDDEFNQLLSQIKSQNALVVIDACHSGTATKSISLARSALAVNEGVSKFFSYKGMPYTARSFKVNKRDRVSSQSQGNSAKYVSISAAADNETSIATRAGSIFTQGIKEAVMQAKMAGDNSMTPRKLWQISSEFVTKNTEPAKRFTPQINGDNALMDKPLRLLETPNGRGPVWRKVEQLAEGSGGINIQANKNAFIAGENLTIKLDVPDGGFLNIISVGPDDVPTILFPNQEHPENRVNAGTVQIPSDMMPFDIVAQAPFGANLVVAVLTQKPINLFQNADGQRDGNKKLNDMLGRLSEAGLLELKSFKVQSNRKQYKAGKLEARTCENAAACN